MMVLDTDRISARSFCYKVWRERDKYLFETDNRIVYVVSFDPYDGFAGYEQRMRYSIHTAMVKDENVENYIALILQVSHPYHDEIVSYFESIIDLFNENKPE